MTNYSISTETQITLIIKNKNHEDAPILGKTTFIIEHFIPIDTLRLDICNHVFNKKICDSTEVIDKLTVSGYIRREAEFISYQSTEEFNQFKHDFNKFATNWRYNQKKH